MTSELAQRLTMEQPALAGAPASGQGGLAPVRALAAGAAATAAAPAGPHAALLRSRRDWLRRRLLAVADMLAAAVATSVVLGARGGSASLLAVAAAPLVVVVFKLAGLYDRDNLRIVHSTLDELPRLVQLTGVSVLCLAILEPLVLGRSTAGAALAELWLGGSAAIAGARAAARSLAGRLAPVERCLVLGELHRAERVRARLASSRARAEVVAALPLAGHDVQELGDPDEMRRFVRQLRVDRVIIAPTTTDHGALVELIRLVKAMGVRVSVVPRMCEALGSAVEFDDVDGMTMLGVRPFGLSRTSQLVKRAFDLAVGSLVMLFGAPVIALTALAIRLDTPGPVFFRQTRVGRDGRHFQIFKFRSMRVHADREKAALRTRNEAGDGLFKIRDDPRVTRVGRFLRRTSLDELPQLFNVLQGDMSLVGPRPLVVEEDAEIVGLDRSRLQTTPGMTGRWQVSGERVPMAEMVGLDYLYVANWSPWEDVKLIVRTVRHVLRGGNQ